MLKSEAAVAKIRWEGFMREGLASEARNLGNRPTECNSILHALRMTNEGTANLANSANPEELDHLEIIASSGHKPDFAASSSFA
jgi:hypothetical protein